MATTSLTIRAFENNDGTLRLTGSATGMANGTEINFTLIDDNGNGTVATAVVSNGKYAVTDIWAGMFNGGDVHISGFVGDVQAQADLTLSGINLVDPVTITTAEFDAGMLIDVNGDAPALVVGSTIKLTIRDAIGGSVKTTGVVGADHKFSIQNIDPQSLSAGTLSFDVTGVDASGALSIKNVKTLEFVRDLPEGTDNVLTMDEDTALTITAANFGFSSTSGHVLTGVKITSLPLLGTLKLNGIHVVADQVISKADLDDGKLVYQGAQDGNGPSYANLKFKVQDDRLNNNEDGVANTLTFNVTPVNDAAIISGPTTGAVIEAGSDANSNVIPGTPTATGTLTSTDVDGTANAFTAVTTATATTGGYGTYTMTAAGVWTYMLDNSNNAVQALVAGATLTDTFTVTAADGTAKEVSVTITGTNDAAIISSTGATGSVTEAGSDANSNVIAGTPTTTGTLKSTDVDGTANAFTAVTEATATTGGYGTYTMTASGVWTYTVNNNNATVQALAAGATLTDTFTVTAADGTTQEVSVTITGANDAALISGTAAGTVTEAGSDANGITIAGTPTTTGTLTSTDVDGTANTFTAVTEATASTGGYGTYTMTAEGMWAYTLDNSNATVQALTAAATLTDTFTVTAADGTTQEVSVTITGANDAALISGTTTGAVTEAGGAVNVIAGTPTATGTLTSTDADGTANTFTAVTEATASTGGYGTYTMTAEGVWAYTLDNSNATVQALTAAATLTDTFTVTAADGTTQEVSVTITGANDAALISGTAAGTVTEAGSDANGIAIAGTPTATGTLTSTDVDGTANAFTPVTEATASTGGYGTYTMTATGVWTYTVNNNNATVQALAAGVALTDTFTVTAADGTTQEVSVTITGANDAAEIRGDTAKTLTESNAAQTATGTLTASDVDGAANSFQAQTNVAGANNYGTFSLTTAGVWTYTMNSAQNQFKAGQTYTDSFTAKAADGTVQTVTVTIEGTNNAPVLVDTALNMSAVIQGSAVPTGAVGMLVSALVGGVSDADADAVKGIAITGVNSAKGTVYFSTNGGANWSELTSVSEGNARLLAADADNRVYFKAASSTQGTVADALTFRAWDGTTGTDGSTGNASVNDGTTAFSKDSDTVSDYVVAPVTINPVSVDNLISASEPVIFTGKADPNAAVTLNINGQSTSVTADGAGNWSYDASKVRYIMVRKSLLNLASSDPEYNLKGIFTLGEVEVYERASGTNIAGWGGVTQSYSNASQFTTGSLRDMNAYYSAGHYVETSGSQMGLATGVSQDAWVQIDLGTAYALRNIKLVSAENQGARMNGATIYTSMTDMSSLTRAQLDASPLVNSSTPVSGVSNSGWQGSWASASAINGSPLNEGANTITASESVQGVNHQATATVTLDTIAPTTTVLTAALSADTGTSATDFITSVAAQTISGTLSANLAADEKVMVSLDNGTTWTAATATVGTSTWSLAGVTLSGSNTMLAKVVDTAGNGGAPYSHTYAYVPVSNLTVGIARIEDNAGTASTVLSGGTSNDTTPTLVGTLGGATQGAALGTNEVVNVYRTPNLAVATVVQAGTMADEPILSGNALTHYINGDGNYGPTGNVYLPTTPANGDMVVITKGAGWGISVYAGSTLVGNVGTAGVHSGGTDNLYFKWDAAKGQWLTGTNAMVKVGTATVTTNAAGQSTWTLTDNTVLGNSDSVLYVAQVENTSGTFGQQSTPGAFDWKYTVDNVAPSSISLIGTDDVGPVTGTIMANSVTNDNKPTFSGSTEANAVVSVYNGATMLGTTTANGSGVWSFTPATALDEGTYNITATATDTYGNTSAPSTALPFKIDTTAPVAVADANTGTEDIASLTGNLGNNDTSKDGSEIYEIVGSAVGAKGTLVLNTNGVYTYTRTSSADEITSNLVETFTYKVTDAAGNTTQSTLKITLTPVNDAAVIAGDLSKTLTETDAAQTATGTLTSTDVDGTPNLFTAQTNVAGSNGYGKFSLTTAGVWTYTMNSAQNQFVKDQTYTDSFNAKAADGTTKQVTVTITGTNDAAVISSTGSTGALTESDVAQSTTGTLTSTDVDGTPNLFTAQTNVAGSNGYGKFSMTTAGVWTYTMNSAQNQFVKDQTYTDSFNAKAADGTTKQVIVTITGTNDAAVISSTGSTGALTESDVAQSTTGTLTSTDVDGTPNLFTAQTNVAGSNGYGKFSMTTAGVWTYTMNSAQNQFVKDQTYTDSFTAKAADGTTKQVTVTITGTNDAAVISSTGSTGALTESDVAQSTTGTLTSTDVDGTPNLFTAQTNVAGSNGYGKFSMTTAGVWTYTMDSAQNQFKAGQNYTDSFTAKAADGTTKQVSVTITGTNDAPVLVDTALNMSAVIQGSAVPTGAVGMLVSSLVGGVSDADADAVQGIAITGVNSAKGTLYFSTDNGANWSTVVSPSDSNARLLLADSDNRVYFKAASNATGTISDAFTFRAWDKSGGAVDGSSISLTGLIGATGSISQASDTVSQYVVAPVTINAVSTDNLVNGTEALMITGKADPGATVALNINNQVVNVTADSSGDWSYDGSKVRYVMVRKTLQNLAESNTNFDANGVMTIGDVTVMSGGTNVALNATQTTSNRASFLYTNGNYYDQSIKDNSVTTFAEAYGFAVPGGAGGDVWVQLDLGDWYSVDRINVRARPDLGLRMNGTKVYASTHDMSGLTTAQLNAAVTVSAPSTITGVVAAGSGTYSVISPVSAYATSLVAGSNTITASESVQGVNSQATAVVTLDATAPVAVADIKNTDEDTTPITGTVATNDTNKDGTESYAIVGSAAGTYGTLTMNANGTYSYARAVVLDHIQTTAVETFTYKVTDAAGNTSQSTLTINMAPVNDTAVISGTAAGAVTEAGGVANATAGTPTATGTLTSTDVDGIANAFTAVAAGTASTGGYGTYAMTAAGVWTYTLNNSNATVQALAAGAKLTDTFTVTAADGTPKQVSVTITGANDAPVMEIAIPNQTATLGAVFNYTVPTGSFSDLDSTLTYTATRGNGTALPAWLTFDAATRTFSGTPTSTTDLNIKVTASDGTANTSSTFSLALSPVASSVAITSTTGIQNNFLNAGDTVTATVNFSEIVNVTGTPQLTVNIGGTLVKANYFGGSGTSALTFTYTILPGQTDANGIGINANSLGLNGGTITDAQGNNATQNFAAITDNISYKVDTTAPSIGTLTLTDTGSSPSDGISQSGTVNVGALESGATWEYSTDNGSTWTAGSGTSFTLAAGTYAAGTVQMRETDLAGNVQTGALIAKNAAAINVDQTAPLLAGSNPGDNGYLTNVANNLVLNFNENVAKGTGVIQLYKADGTLIESFDVATSALVTGWGTANLSINPTNNLLATTGYYIKIAPTAIKDVAGNAYAGIGDATTLNFTTADANGAIEVPIHSGVNSLLSLSGIGDFNGDGYDDMIIGAKEMEFAPGTNSWTSDGAAFVVYGNASGIVPTLVGGTIAASAGFRIRGPVDSEFGTSVSSAGDVNGDGLADVLIGAPNQNGWTGTPKVGHSAWVIYGQSNTPTVYGSELNLFSGNIAASQGFRISGWDDAFGYQVDNAGDVNGDGLTDFIVSDYGNIRGSAFVIYGKTTGAPIDLLDNVMDASEGFAIRGSALGLSVSGAGDVNGDGMADLLVSHYENSGTDTGAVFVVYGNKTGTTVDLGASHNLDMTQGFKVTGVGNTHFGYGVSSAGDVNGDGLADFMVSASEEPNGGAVYVVYGSSAGAGLDLALTTGSAYGAITASRGFKITSNYANAVSILGKLHMSSAGDINGDGLGDLFMHGVSDTYFATSDNTQSDYVIYGNASGAGVTIDSNGNIATSQGFLISGGIAGESIANAGDINGDGLNDLMISGRKYEEPGLYTHPFDVILGGTQWVTSAVNGAGSFAGSAASEALIGSPGNDTLTGGGGVDRFYAGMGDDTIVLSASDIANLQSTTTGQTAKAQVSGGTGFDTLRLSGGTAFDLLTVANAGAMGLNEISRIEGIERIDMATDTAANALKISAKDVNDMAGFDRIHTGSVSEDGKVWTNVSGTALGAVTRFHQMVIDGGSNDTVALSAGNGVWATAGTVSNGTASYTVYQNDATTSQVLVQQGVTVNAQAPVLLLSSPADEAYVTNLAQDIKLTFSEAVVKGNGSIQLWNRTADTLVEIFDAATSTLVTGWGTNVLTINPSANLTAGNSYFLKIGDSAIQDATGVAFNGINDHVTLNFDTQAAGGSFLVSASYKGDADSSKYLKVVTSAGDFNGDGYDDLLVSCPTSGSANVYVVYGNATGTGLDLDALSYGPNGSVPAELGFLIQGAGNLGISASGVGDVNGDGFADVLLGANTTNSNAGAAYVVYGNANPAALNLSSGTIAASQGFKMTGGCANGSFGTSVSAVGDFNGDGINDFVIGATNVNAVVGGGAAYVVYGKTGGSAMTLATNGSIATSDGLLLSGGVNENAGLSVSGAGDVNGDGLADVIIGANESNLSNGAAYVVYGGATGGTLAAVMAAGQGFKITGATSGGYAVGTSVSSAGDVNGDGFADVIVGTDTDQSFTAAYVVYGGPTATAVSLAGATIAASQGFRITGYSSSVSLSQVSSAGDMNGDGLGDLLVGSSYGSSYVVYGNTTGAEVSLISGTIAASQGFKLSYSTYLNANSAISVSTAGDLNGDGLTDLVIGDTGQGNTASYKIVFGGTQWISNAVVGNGTVTGTATSEAILGSEASDSLTGGGGVDRFFGGLGNDTIVLTASDVSNLANNTVNGVKASVNGGGGYDTIQLSGGANLNLTTISNAGGMGLEENSRIESIERIAMGADTAANTLTLTARDVKDMAGFNVFHTGSLSADGKTWSNVTGTALSATTKFHQLLVDGSTNDTLVFAPDLGFWTNVGTVSNGTFNYTVYQNTGTNTQVLARSGMLVTNNDSVAPVVIDLNRDGQLDYGNVVMDVNGDGQADSTAWAGAKDGVLVWDKLGDGLVHNNSQYAFSQYGAAGSTDLQGLAAGFDTNHDGVFNAQDAKFAEFKVWQDANQNGVSDAGEVRSLADWGIDSIHLASDGVVRTPVEGVTEAGRTTATSTDGASVLVSDAAFAYEAVSYSLQGTALMLNDCNMRYDLSSFVSLHGAVDSVELSGAGGNTLKIGLQDVLTGSTSGSLWVKGDADDTVVLDASVWKDAGQVLGQDGHTYAQFTNGMAHLLMDQAIMYSAL